MNSVRLFTNPKRSLILLIALAALMVMLSSIPFAPLYFISIGFILFPVAGLILSAVGGWAALALAGAIIAYGAFRLFGMTGVMVLAYTLPAGAALLVCIELKLAFPKTLAVVLASFVVGVLAFYLLAQRATGGNLFGYAARATLTGLDGLTQRDTLLYNLWKGGLLAHGQPEGTQVFIENGQGWTFTPAVLDEFYKQISFRVESLLQSVFQGLLTSFGIYIAALGSYLALRLGGTSLPDSCPNLGMPPFQLWHISKPLGNKLWVLAAGYLLMLIGSSPVIQLAGALMFNVFYAIYVIQGMAVFDFRLSQGHMRPWLRYLILLLLFVILQPMMVFIGILDQLRDTRGLRQEHRETGE